MTAKKKRLIIISIIFVALLITAGFIAFCIAKHKASQRYLQYEELEPTQIVLIDEYAREYLTEEDIEIRVNIRAIDVEGNLYSVNVPYEEWNGVEAFYSEIITGEKTINYINTKDMEVIYNYLVQTDTNRGYYDYVREEGPYFISLPFCEGKFYGIRYKADGTMEYIKYWEQFSYYNACILDDPLAEEIYDMGGRILMYGKDEVIYR